MSWRMVGALSIVSTSTVLFLGSTAAGCSDDEPAASDGGSDTARPDANRPAPLEDDPLPKTCREQCEEAHPAGLPKDEAVNSCWDAHCRAPCIEDMPSDAGYGGDGGGDGASPDGGTCTSPVVTISLACDECTNTFCCAEWDGCFQEPECVALNACYQQCTE